MSILPNEYQTSQIYPEKPKKSRIRRILFKSYKPQPSIKTAIIVLAILGVVFIVIGTVLVIYGLQIKEFRNKIEHWYEDKNDELTEVKVEVDQKMKKPVFVYYQINEYFQNHRAYVQSISYKQLEGNEISREDADQQCHLADTKGDLKNRYGNETINKVNSNQNEVAYPCGIIAKSFFNISIKGPDGYLIDDNDITWEYDKDHRFKQNNDKTYWTDVENEHFISWMKLSARKDFKKLWGKIDQDLKKGSYNFNITKDKHNPIPKGKKVYLILSTSTTLGGNNKNLGIVYITVGSLTIFSAIFFAIRGLLFRKSDDYHPSN